MISNSTISNSTFNYNVQKLSVSNAIIDRCKFQGLINQATITGNLTKCQFEGLSDSIVINGPLNDMTIQVDITPTSAYYAQRSDIPTQYISIQQLQVDSVTIPRLAETLHKECYVNTIGGRKVFIVQLGTDDNNPSGVIIMFYPGTIDPPKTLADVIPKGYVLCDGQEHNGVRTPNLQGRFIRAAVDENDVGPHDNSELTQQEGAGRYAYIQIHDYNLPSHTHVFNLTADIDITGLSTDSQGQSYQESYNYVSGHSGTSVNAGTGSSVDTGETISTTTGYINFDWTHSHSINGTASLTNISLTQDTEQENYINNKINIEPNAYALVFIMKL